MDQGTNNDNNNFLYTPENVKTLYESPPCSPAKRLKLTGTPPATKTSVHHLNSYSDKDFKACLSMVKATPDQGKRLVARTRLWSSSQQKYGPWTLHHIGLCNDTNTSRENANNSRDILTLKMNRGGVITFFPELLKMDDVGRVRDEMMSVKEYRQYKVQECGKEPRLHALFSSKEKGEGGYQYGQVTMGNHPLQSLNTISQVAQKLARQFNIPNEEWNIGCHLVIYRDGKDSISWHADDTQGEDLILSLTVDTPHDTRSICFQPSNDTPLVSGDEQIELYPIPGDAYSMDGQVQHGYVHAMLKVNKLNQQNQSRRMAIIFRNGIPKRCCDNGQEVEAFFWERRPGSFA
jgi:alkylated DNA repair dioxygenase AlkB